MNVPGSNLLNMALTVIAKQTVQYYAFISRSTNSIGYDNAVYAAPVTMYGSIQAVPRELYQEWGLNFQKDYKIFYTPNNVIDIARDVSGDQFTFAGKRYQCESKTDWKAIDGWVGVLAVVIT